MQQELGVGVLQELSRRGAVGTGPRGVLGSSCALGFGASLDAVALFSFLFFSFFFEMGEITFGPIGFVCYWTAGLCVLEGGVT